MFNVSQITPGIYHYNFQQKGLQTIREGNFRELSETILCGMTAPRIASFLLILSFNIEKAQKIATSHKVAVDAVFS